MGKAQLKKEIAGFTREQLEQMVIEAYSARKEVKEYFDFFLNPDVKKLHEKYMTIVVRELKRTRHGTVSKCRVSVIKKAIRDFASFQPGFESEVDFSIEVVAQAMHAEKYVYFNNTMFNAFATITMQTLALADRNMQAESVLQRVLTLLRSRGSGTEYFRRHLLMAIGQDE